MDVVHVGDRIIVPKDVHVLIPETVNILPYRPKGTLHIWLRILRWRGYSGLSGRPKVLTRVLVRGSPEDLTERRWKQEAESDRELKMLCLWL